MREHYDLSINALASATNLSRRTILRAEKGLAIYPSSRQILCAYFGQLEGRTVTSAQLGLLGSPQKPSLSEETQDNATKETMETVEMNMKRRNLIIRALRTAGVTLTIPSLMHPGDLEHLVAVMNHPSQVDAPTLTYLESIIDSCWYLSNESKIAIVEQILPVYLPYMVTFAYQPSKYQRKAAYLASQGYILAAEVDRGNIHAMQAYCQQAILYSQIAENYDIQVAALKQQATIYLVGNQPEEALLRYQKTLRWIKHVSPLLRSRVYLGLASAYARCQQKQEALRYLGLAHESFPAQPEKDPHYLYTVCSRAVLHLYEALTYTDLNQLKDAWESLIAVDGLHPKLPVPTSTRIEFLNLQAKVAAAQGNMEMSTCYLRAGVDASSKQGYCLWQREAWNIYQEMEGIWPNEPQVHALRELFLQ